MKKRLIKLITKLLKKEETTKPNIEYKSNNDTIENSQITIITKHFEELYNNINIGDIYFAYMPLVKEELDAIEETHRRRPYVIVKKENGKVYGYACYGKKYSWLKSNEYFHLDNRIYDVNKDGYIVLDEIFEIPLENIIRYYLTLSPKTIRDIEKRILITNNQRTPLPTFEIGYDIEIGDIFLLDKQLYYVYQKDNTHIYTHKVFKNQHIDNIKLVRIRVDNKDYFISYLKQEQFSSKEQYCIVKMLTREQQEHFNELKQKLKKQFSVQKNMPEEFNLLYKPGQLLNDKYIYLYNLGYKIYGLYLFEKRDKKPKFIRIREADIEVTGCLTLRETKIIVNKFIKSKVDPHHLLDKYFKILVINE